MPSNFFGLCDEKREIRTSSDNWNEREKTQQGKIACKDVGWTNEAAQSGTSDRSPETSESDER